MPHKNKIKNLIKVIRKFDFIKFCIANAPKQEYIYALLGLFCIISFCSAVYLIPEDAKHHYNYLITFVFHVVLMLSNLFCTYPIWPPTVKKEKIIAVMWNLFIPYLLVFAPTLLALITNLGQFQLIVLMINMIIISVLLRWQVALFMIVIGFLGALEYCQIFIGVNNLPTNIGNTQAKIIYTLLLVSSILVAFLKPKQEGEELLIEQSKSLINQISTQKEELKRLLNLKHEFIKNLNHEIKIPITGMISVGPSLWENYDKITENDKRELVKIMAESSIRLMTFTNNILNFSELSSLKYDLNIQKVDLGKIIYRRLDYCKKLYVKEKELEFLTDIEDDLEVNCDEYYMIEVLDNLISNAINYSNKGVIVVSLEKINSEVEFRIKDEGIGIPEDELFGIFELFVVSSKTKTITGGRGVGLALCKKVIELHGGKIYAESDGSSGSIFRFNIPIDVANK